MDPGTMLILTKVAGAAKGKKKAGESLQKDFGSENPAFNPKEEIQKSEKKEKEE